MKNIQYFEDFGKHEFDRGWVRNNVGKYVAYKNYKESIRMGSDDYELSDPPYNEEDTKMFLETLVEAGIERFCYTAKTTLTIEFLHVCKNCGWNIIEIGTIHRVNDVFGEEDIQGIWVSR